MDAEIVGVLKEIRDEAKQTNVRLASVEDHVASIDGEAKDTNKRLASLEGRVEFLEKRMSKGFEAVNERLDAHVARFAEIEQYRVESEMRLSTTLMSIFDMNRQIRDGILRRSDDHELVLQHETRITAIEERLDHEPR